VNDSQPPPQEGALLEAHDDVFAQAHAPRSRWDEARRFPRFEVRSEIEATIYPREASSDQEPTRTSVMMRDLSRGGMNVLYVEQLYPGQRIDVVLHNGARRAVEVIWCRRMAHRCYTIGCRFVKTGGGGQKSEVGDQKSGN
jgi:hypothetical protein